eukprot:258355-Alexandrium_andersonii.AAC.1
MLGVLVQFVRRSRSARGHCHGVHSYTVARSCPSVRVLGADGAIVLILCLRGIQLLAVSTGFFVQFSRCLLYTSPSPRD